MSAAKPNAAELLAGFDQRPDISLVGRDVVAALYECSYSALARRVKAGIIPEPYSVGGSIRWRVGDLRSALEPAATTAPTVKAG